MDSDEEYPSAEVISTITISRSDLTPPPGLEKADNSADKNYDIEVEEENLSEIEVPFPEVKGLARQPSSNKEEEKSFSKRTFKNNNKTSYNDNDEDDDDDEEEDELLNRKPLRGAKFQGEDPYQNEEYPEEQEDPSAEDLPGHRSNKGRAVTKVAIRRLPPTMTKEEFMDAVQPLPEYNYAAMINPDKVWGFEARSVAHINFLEEEDALWFMERFTGYQFIDRNGEEYVSICDAAIHPGVPKKGKENRKRGTLEQTEHFQEFLKRYEENPYTLEGDAPLAPEGEIITPEMMLTELEERITVKDVATTPLLEFLRNKKAESRKERDIKRQKERRNTDKRETSESKYRELKRERKRERRDKERKERREKDKLEKEAKTKGMTVTYSKSGKVTRWSQNSNPFPKKTDEEKSQNKTSKDEKGSEKLSSISEDKETKTSAGNDKDKSGKSDRFDKPEPKKKIINPLQSKGRPSDSKKSDYNDEKRFCKPFPIREDKKKETSQNRGDKASDKPSSASSSEKPVKKVEPPSSSSTDAQKASAEESKGKKKIVKKIIKVRRVRPKNSEDGSEAPPANGGDKDKDAPKKVPFSKPKPDSSKTKEISKPKSEDAPKSSKGAGGSNNSKPDEKSESKKSSEDKTTSSGSKSSKVEDEGAKRRRARPDMQIYRPGSRLRTGAAAASKPNSSDSKSTEKETNES